MLSDDVTRVDFSERPVPRLSRRRGVPRQGGDRRDRRTARQLGLESEVALQGAA
jgi:hypothetical protein